MIRGNVEDPSLTMDNDEIAQRHVTAYLLQRYHQGRLPNIDLEQQPQLFEVLGTVRSFVVGSRPEVALCADRLSVKGRVDLLTLSAERADIVDHRTGTQDPSHLDQVRFYAMSWDQDDIANDARTPLGSLAASYPTVSQGGEVLARAERGRC